jgi:biopolymer transport protein ExbD
MKLWNNSEEDGEVDLTPMIDIVFLLIVFFMTVANMITAEKKPIDVPVALNSTIPEDYGERTTITIQRDGSLYSGVFDVTLEELRTVLIDAQKQDPTVKVYLRADSAAEHQYVNDVMKACAAAGLSNVIFAAFQSDK